MIQRAPGAGAVPIRTPTRPGRMTLTVRNAIVLGFAAALLVLLGNAAVAHRNIADLTETERRVARAHEIQDALERFLSTVKDAETGQRGYVITGQEAYLAPYD